MCSSDLLPRAIALELFKPWLYERLERAGHVTKIKEAKKLVEQLDARALAFAAELAAELPLVLFHEKPGEPPRVVSVTCVLWDEPSLGLSPEVSSALGLAPGHNVVMHVPIDPLAVAEARALTLDKAPREARTWPEGWLAQASREPSPGGLVLSAAVHGSVDRVRDRWTRLLLSRLDAD